MTDDSKLPLLAGYVDDELTADERAEVDLLLADAPSLQVEVESQRQVNTLLAAQRPAEPDEADWERVWREILSATSAETAPLSVVGSWWGKLASLAAAAAVVLALVWWVQPAPPGNEGLSDGGGLHIELAKNDDVIIENIDSGVEGITVLLMASGSGQVAPVIWVVQEPE